MKIRFFKQWVIHMNKALSIILNIVAIIFAVVILLFGVFCAYDWLTLAKTPYAYTIEFWLVIDYYSAGMITCSLIGLAATIVNLLTTEIEKIKKMSKIFTFAFIVLTVISIVLYILPISF